MATATSAAVTPHATRMVFQISFTNPRSLPRYHGRGQVSPDARCCRQAKKRSIIIFETPPSSRCPTRAIRAAHLRFAGDRDGRRAGRRIFFQRHRRRAFDEPRLAFALDQERVAGRLVLVGDLHRSFVPAGDGGDPHRQDGPVGIVTHWIQRLAAWQTAGDDRGVDQQVPDPLAWCVEGVGGGEFHASKDTWKTRRARWRQGCRFRRRRAAAGASGVAPATC